MELKWTRKGHSDLVRLYEFLAPINREAATRIARRLAETPGRLLEHPRLGERLEEFHPRDVRRLLIGAYEMRYELSGQTIYILRIWHTREDR